LQPDTVAPHRLPPEYYEDRERSGPLARIRKKKTEAKIREEVRERRGLARDSRTDPESDLKANREADLSRANAYSDEDIRILTDPNVPEASRNKLFKKIRQEQTRARDVQTPLKRMGLRSDSDPDAEYFPVDELDDIVRPIPHPFGKAYILLAKQEAKKKKTKPQFTDEDARVLFLGDGGNVLTVEINTSHDFQDVVSVMRRIWNQLECGTNRGTNLGKIKELREAYKNSRIYGRGKKAKTSTVLKRINKAKKLVCGKSFAKGQRLTRRVEKSDLDFISCCECPQVEKCVRLCDKVEAYTNQDHVSQREKI